MKAPNLFTFYPKVEEHLKENSCKTLKTVELFAGVGGFRVGLERASNSNIKFDVIWSNQWEPSTKIQHASDIYCARFGYENHSNDDIGNVDSNMVPEHDLLVGGFPCQDYSVASTLKNAQGILGKKGVLWWQIFRLLEEKKEKAPKYLLLENVDRLLKSPATQRGRDFALILASLNSLGYAVEWRVIDASAYGMPQRRKRIFILGYKKETALYQCLQQTLPASIFNHDGLLAQAFPIQELDMSAIASSKLSNDFVDISNNFNKNIKNSPFLDAGYMIDGTCYTAKITPNYCGMSKTLKDALQDEASVPKEFYIDEQELEKWKYHKGSKSYNRVDKTTGHTYTYSEGSMSFPDSLDKPARTIITGEGGKSPSRFKHIVHINGKYRRLTPLELERLNMFPDNHTLGMSDTKRAFLMGNALVVGIVTQIGTTLLKRINDDSSI